MLGNYRCKSTCGKRERKDTKDHEEDAEDALCLSRRRNVAIAHCHNSRHGEVEGRDIEVWELVLCVTFL